VREEGISKGARRRGFLVLARGVSVRWRIRGGNHVMRRRRLPQKGGGLGDPRHLRKGLKNHDEEGAR